MHYQLRLLGHVSRMPASHLPRKTVYGQLHQDQRSAGGPKKGLKDQLKSSLKKHGIKPHFAPPDVDSANKESN